MIIESVVLPYLLLVTITINGALGDTTKEGLFVSNVEALQSFEKRCTANGGRYYKPPSIDLRDIKIPDVFTCYGSIHDSKSHLRLGRCSEVRKSMSPYTLKDRQTRDRKIRIANRAFCEKIGGTLVDNDDYFVFQDKMKKKGLESDFGSMSWGDCLFDPNDLKECFEEVEAMTRSEFESRCQDLNGRYGAARCPFYKAETNQEVNSMYSTPICRFQENEDEKKEMCQKLGGYLVDNIDPNGDVPATDTSILIVNDCSYVYWDHFKARCKYIKDGNPDLGDYRAHDANGQLID